MDQLTQLLSAQCGLDSNELRKLRFKYPQKGLLQALRHSRGDEAADALLQKVASEFSIEFVPGEKITIDPELIKAAGAEISRLGFALKAVPLKIVAQAQGEALLLAMSNPSDTHTRAVFSKLFSKAVKPLLCREDELLEALRFQIPSGTRGTRILRSTDAPENESSHVTDGLKALLTGVIESNGRELHFAFLGANVVANLIQSANRSTTVECSLKADELVQAVLARSRVLTQDKEAFTGVGYFSTLPTGIDFEFEYVPEYKAESGEKGRLFKITNIQVKDEKDLVFWSSPNAKMSAKLYETLEQNPGLYLLACPNPDMQTTALSALQRLFPDLHVVKEVKELGSDPDTARRLQYSRVVLPIKASGVAHVLQLLEKAAPSLKSLIRGLIGYSELARPCQLCATELKTPSETLGFFPAPLHDRLQKTNYPRGCPVCQQSGYLGISSILSFIATDASFGEAFRNGTSSKELVPLMRKESWIPIAEVALEQTLAAKMILEEIAATFLGKTINNSKPLASRFDGSLAPLETSPLERKDSNPSNQVDFHSVVLEAGGDLLAAREALLAEENEQSAAATFLGTHAASSSNAKKPSTGDSGHDFHSVVLDLDDDMASMREKLLAEFDDD